MKTRSENYIFASSQENRPDARQAAASSPAFALLLIGSGIGLFAWSFFSDEFLNANGDFFSSEICLPFAVSSALILSGVFINTKWKFAAFWSALALSGQAAALQMIDAGRTVHFQHYRSVGELFDGHYWLLILLAGQVFLVTHGIGKRLLQIKEWIRESVAFWRLALIVVFLIFSGAAVTPRLSIYAASLFFAAIVQLASLGNIILAVWSVPDESIENLRRRFKDIFSDSRVEKIDSFALTAAVWTISITAFLSFFVYENHPHVPDETQYLFQAKLMAAGQLTAEPPLVPEAFAMYMTPYLDERWYGIFPPAYPAILAVGVFFGVPWLVNPVLAGLCVLLAYLFFQQMYSRRFARIGILLLCCSPWFLFMAMSFMSHVFTLTCTLAAAVLLNKSIAEKKLFYTFGAGVFIGIVSLIRPLDGLIVALLLGVWTLFKTHLWREKIKTSTALVFGTISTASIIFFYNNAVTGKATMSPSDAYYTKYFWADVMALGFGANRGMGWGLDALPGHSFLEAIINSALNVFLVNIELFGWTVGSLFPVIFLLFTGKPSKTDYWAWTVIAAVISGYGLFWYHGGPDFGARYWFLAIVPLIALTVRAIERISRLAKNSRPNMQPRVWLGAAILAALSLTVYMPWRSVNKYYRYLEMQPGILHLNQSKDFGKSLVIVSGQEHPDYQSAWIYNPINFRGDAPIYAHDKDPETRARLLNAYAELPVWLVDGPTRAGGEYKVVKGPVSAREILTPEQFK